MELCLNVLLGLGVFWIGIITYCACMGCRFGFDIDNPKQLRKLILKPITKVIILGGILIIVYSLFSAGVHFFELPLVIPFIFVVGLGFFSGLAIGVWDASTEDDFLKSIQKIMAYPICLSLFISSFYFVGIFLFLFLNK